jgi:hypothetical protein
MRHFFSSFCRLIAGFLVMTILTTSIAMAAYACPQLAVPVEKMEMAMDTPCAEMDQEKPVQCAEYQSSAQLALEHLAATPSFTPVTVSLVIPALPPVIPVVPVSIRADIPLDGGTDPPYLRTLRLRI